MRSRQTSSGFPVDDRIAVLQAALEYMGEGFTVYDADLNLLAWNQRFFDLLELPRSLAYIGAPLEDFLRWNAARGEYGPVDVESYVAEHVELALQFVPHRFERVRPNGTVLEVRGNPIPGLGFVTVYNDISERKQVERQLQESVDHLEHRVRERMTELEAANRRMQAEVAERNKAEATLRHAQKMEAIGALTGGLAHDFNNLLTIVMGNLALVEDLGPLPGEAGAMIGEALDASRRGADLVRRLLSFSRRQPLSPATYDPKRVVADIEPLLSRALGDDIELAIEFAGEDWLIEADRSEFENALLNMANNSRDAMPDGGRLTIRVETRPHDATARPDLAPGDHLVVTVTDTGCGMPPDVRERAFEPFFTAKKSDGGGTGLGLSMVYGFVRRSGGVARILSTVGQGTTIELVLPRHHPAEAPADAPAAPGRPLGGSEHILLVEDDIRVRGFVRRTLEGLGYRISEATDGQQALALLASGGTYDLVLSDIEMPGGVSGLELAARVEDHVPGTRILLMSGYPDRAMARADWRDRPVLSKPFGPRELAEAIRDRLGRAAS
ncbi:hypothetical protein GCM10011611_26550 [Aliidongia dinghuensis]|uniref:histidine kinase n=1 Tax=Aliidongia dinghuensis TaxID=1867774 RepID=A0A8J3E2A2_9PROT|nr:PAS-domain containing protein [Aliidongia dinghuensis]GGF19323.1 hypothetical protein GCM10011611_26550 [Aliidongia dinghuensis]